MLNKHPLFNVLLITFTELRMFNDLFLRLEGNTLMINLKYARMRKDLN